MVPPSGQTGISAGPSSTNFCLEHVGVFSAAVSNPQIPSQTGPTYNIYPTLAWSLHIDADAKASQTCACALVTCPSNLGQL